MTGNNRGATLLRTLALIGLFLFCFGTVSAQISIGGRVGYGNDRTDDGQLHRITVMPDVGYALTERWSIGLLAGYEASLGSSHDSHGVLLAPYVSYTWLNSGRVALFTDGGMGWAMGSDEGFEAGLTPGISVALTGCFSMELSLGFVGYRQGCFNGGNRGWHFELLTTDLQVGVEYNF